MNRCEWPLEKHPRCHNSRAVAACRNHFGLYTAQHVVSWMPSARARCGYVLFNARNRIEFPPFSKLSRVLFNFRTHKTVSVSILNTGFLRKITSDSISNVDFSFYVLRLKRRYFRFYFSSIKHLNRVTIFFFPRSIQFLLRYIRISITLLVCICKYICMLRYFISFPRVIIYNMIVYDNNNMYNENV